MADINQRPVFALSPPDQRGVRTLVTGIPIACWRWIRDGKTVHFDLNRIGLPLQFMFFGGATHGSIRETLEGYSKEQGRAVLHDRATDYAINDLSDEGLAAGAAELRRLNRGGALDLDQLRQLYRAMRVADDAAAIERLQS